MLTPNSHSSGLTPRNWQDIQQRQVATAWITADSQHALNRFTARRWRRSVCLQCGATLANVVRVARQVFDKEKQPADCQVIDKSMIIIHKWYQMFVNAIPGLIRHGDWMNLQGTWKESSHLLLFFRLGLWASVWYQSEKTSTSLLLRDFAVSTQCFFKRLPVLHQCQGIYHKLGFRCSNCFRADCGELRSCAYSCVFLTRTPSYTNLGTFCLIRLLQVGNTLILNAHVANAW